VGQRHVADAEVVEIAQQAQAVLDGVAAFDADQRRDFVRLVRFVFLVFIYPFITGLEGRLRAEAIASARIVSP